jgi:heptaprenylglyceryl phosphate synthase
MRPTYAELPRYLPLVDPDHFADDEGFFRQLEEIGYRTIMLGGTGGVRLADAVRLIRRTTRLQIVTHPSSPGDVCPVDLLLFPAVMNSNSHYTRPFGSGSVACALAVADMQIPYLPVAYFVLGESTARWYSDAFLVRSKKIILSYCIYATMMGYRHVFLDYEDPDLDIDPSLITLIKQRSNALILCSDEFTPDGARRALDLGTDVIVTPSNLYEQANDPIALAREFYDALLARPAPLARTA